MFVLLLFFTLLQLYNNFNKPVVLYDMLVSYGLYFCTFVSVGTSTPPYTIWTLLFLLHLLFLSHSGTIHSHEGPVHEERPGLCTSILHNSTVHLQRPAGLEGTDSAGQRHRWCESCPALFHLQKLNLSVFSFRLTLWFDSLSIGICFFTPTLSPHACCCQ